MMPLGPGEEAKAKVYRAKVMSYMLYLPTMQSVMTWVILVSHLGSLKAFV